jgi:hypothetical protein
VDDASHAVYDVERGRAALNGGADGTKRGVQMAKAPVRFEHKLPRQDDDAFGSDSPKLILSPKEDPRKERRDRHARDWSTKPARWDPGADEAVDDASHAVYDVSRGLAALDVKGKKPGVPMAKAPPRFVQQMRQEDDAFGSDSPKLILSPKAEPSKARRDRHVRDWSTKPGRWKAGATDEAVVKNGDLGWKDEAPPSKSFPDVLRATVKGGGIAPLKKTVAREVPPKLPAEKKKRKKKKKAVMEVKTPVLPKKTPRTVIREQLLGLPAEDQEWF